MVLRVSDVGVGFDWSGVPAADRRSDVLAWAEKEGLLGARDRAVGGRVPSTLLEAAKARSGIRSDSELLVYALAKVALEDDFGASLLAMKGSVPKDTALDV